MQTTVLSKSMWDLMERSVTVESQEIELNVPKDDGLPGTNVTAPYVIVAGDAFPLMRILMRPYPGPQTKHNGNNRVFKYRIFRAWRLVECSFGILVQTLRMYLRKLKATPARANAPITT